MTAGLLGRDRETRIISGLIDRLPGDGGALLVRGDAGLGKSALLARAEADAAERGVRVLRTAGVESEAQVAFAGLEQLLRPVLADVAGLAPPQRTAVQAAFGQIDADAPDLFLIALAVLNLVSEAATRTPILVVVEDGHWLDRASAEVIAFVARRVDFEPIALLIALRDGYASPLDHVTTADLRLLPLPESDATTLLDRGFPGLSAEVRKRVLLEAEGNPLALMELPVALKAAPWPRRHRHGDAGYVAFAPIGAGEYFVWPSRRLRRRHDRGGAPRACA